MAKITILDETTKYPLQKIGKMAGICWGADVNDVEKNIKRAKDCIEAGHGRVLEYVDIEMVIEEVSARMIREWYTHIAGGPTRLQESTRYVKWNGGLVENMIIPPKVQEVINNDMILANELQSIDDLLSLFYKDLEFRGVPKEDIAMFYPLGMKTKICDKRNLRNLIEMSHKRLCTRAYWEYRKVMREICKELMLISDEWAWIVENYLIPQCDVLGYCHEKKGCGRKPNK